MILRRDRRRLCQIFITTKHIAIIYAKKQIARIVYILV